MWFCWLIIVKSVLRNVDCIYIAKKKKDFREWKSFSLGNPLGVRTRDPFIKSEVLYLLS